jgi:hypothetical protein
MAISPELAALLAEARASLALLETRVTQMVAENKALIVSSREKVAASRHALSLATRHADAGRHAPGPHYPPGAELGATFSTSGARRPFAVGLTRSRFRHDEPSIDEGSLAAGEALFSQTGIVTMRLPFGYAVHLFDDATFAGFDVLFRSSEISLFGITRPSSAERFAAGSFRIGEPAIGHRDPQVARHETIRTMSLGEC